MWLNKEEERDQEEKEVRKESETSFVWARKDAPKNVTLSLPFFSNEKHENNSWNC